MAQCIEHAVAARALPDMSALWKQVYQRQDGHGPQDVDQDLYNGFVGPNDRRHLNQLRGLNPQELAVSRMGFDDKRLPELVFRWRARNWPQTLNPQEQARWEQLRAAFLVEGQGGTRTAEQMFAQIDDLSENASEQGRRSWACCTTTPKASFRKCERAGHALPPRAGAGWVPVPGGWGIPQRRRHPTTIQGHPRRGVGSGHAGSAICLIGFPLRPAFSIVGFHVLSFVPDVVAAHGHGRAAAWRDGMAHGCRGGVPGRVTGAGPDPSPDGAPRAVGVRRPALAAAPEQRADGGHAEDQPAAGNPVAGHGARRAPHAGGQPAQRWRGGGPGRNQLLCVPPDQIQLARLVERQQQEGCTFTLQERGADFVRGQLKCTEPRGQGSHVASVITPERLSTRTELKIPQGQLIITTSAQWIAADCGNAADVGRQRQQERSLFGGGK
jgi:hypothetical protein